MMCDMFLTEDQLDHIAETLNINSGVASPSVGRRKKRQADVNYQYPNNLWPGPIPFVIDPLFASSRSFLR